MIRTKTGRRVLASRSAIKKGKKERKRALIRGSRIPIREEPSYSYQLKEEGKKGKRKT